MPKILLVLVLTTSSICLPTVAISELLNERDACQGLSRAFTTPITSLKGADNPLEEANPTEKRILQDIAFDLNKAFTYKQARIAGSAAGCGIATQSDVEKLRLKAERIYPAGSSESATFAKIVQCAAAREERMARTKADQASNCAQVKANFERIVQRGEKPW